MTGESSFVSENLKFLWKEFHFVMSMKTWRNMACTVCHAQKSLQLRVHTDVKVTPSRRRSAKVLCITVGNFITATHKEITSQTDHYLVILSSKT